MIKPHSHVLHRLLLCTQSISCVGLLHPELHNERLTSLSALFFVLIFLSFYSSSFFVLLKKKEEKKKNEVERNRRICIFFLSLVHLYCRFSMRICIDVWTMYTQENDRAQDVGQSMKNYRIQPSRERKKEREELNVQRKQLPLLMSCRYVHERGCTDV